MRSNVRFPSDGFSRGCVPRPLPLPSAPTFSLRSVTLHALPVPGRLKATRTICT